MEDTNDSIQIWAQAPAWQTDTASTIDQKTLVTDLDSALALSQVARPALNVAIIERPPEWTTGLEGEARPQSLESESVVLALLAGVVLMLMLSYNNCRRMLRSMAHELLGMRRRENAFDERTSGETRTLIMLVVQQSVSMAILLYCALQGHVSMAATWAVLALVGIAAGYYLAQRCTYYIVGYTFASAEGRRYFVEGFTSSQAFLGLALLIPSLLAIFYPQSAETMVWIGLALYVAARIIFISKGFRIFYQNFGSLLYFILYLCTLEIIPPVLVYHLALKTVSQ